MPRCRSHEFSGTCRPFSRLFALQKTSKVLMCLVDLGVFAAEKLPGLCCRGAGCKGGPRGAFKGLGFRGLGFGAVSSFSTPSKPIARQACSRRPYHQVSDAHSNFLDINPRFGAVRPLDPPPPTHKQISRRAPDTESPPISMSRSLVHPPCANRVRVRL